MNVRELKLFGMAMMVAALTIQASRADGDRPSRSQLNEMGLGGLVVMSDEEASAIRGQGFKNGSSAEVWGNSWAQINTPFGGARSENGYEAEGSHFAVGANLSVAGAVIASTGGHGGKPAHGGNKMRGKGGKNWGGMGGNKWPRNGMGGKPHMGGGNHGGGRPRVTAIAFFAGGFSFAAAK